MLYRYKYESESEKNDIINQNPDKYLVEIQNHFDGDFLVFSDIAPLRVFTDKQQILSDGVDTATITSEYAETFSVDGGEDYAGSPFLFSSEVPGLYAITAKSLLHGENSIQIEVI